MRFGQPMQRMDPETMKPPAASWDTLSPRQRAKLQPAPSEHGGKMLEECGPLGDRGAALTAARGPGAHLGR